MKKSVKALFFLSFLLFTILSHAQTPEWVYQYVNPDFSEVSCAIAVDSFGNSYTTGYVGIGPSGGLGIIKLNNAGDEKWIYCNDTLGAGAYGQDIVADDEKIYVAGYSQSISGNKDLIITCVDTSGQAQWIYRDTVALEANAIGLSPTNMIYVAGFTYINSFDIIVMKLDSLGNEKWRYVYDGPAGSYDEATDITMDSEENIYIGGYSTGVGTSTDFTVIKLDSAGNEKWVYRYDGPANYRDEIETIALDIFGNIYMTGWSWGIDWDFCVVKIDSSGQEQWVYRYNGPANWADFSFDIAVDDTGNVYMAGRSMRQDTISLFCVVKIDSGGNEEWMYSTSGPLDEGGAAQHIVLDGLGNIYAAGFFYGIAVVKLTPAGDTLWTYIHPRGGTFDIVADVNGNFYATGRVGVSTFDYDIVVFKFAAQSGRYESESDNTPKAHHASLLFHGSIRINPAQSSTMKIYNVFGQVVTEQYLQEGNTYSFNLPAGVYFIDTQTKTHRELRKVILVK